MNRPEFSEGEMQSVDKTYKHFLKPQLEICIKTHSEALIILQTSKLKVSVFF